MRASDHTEHPPQRLNERLDSARSTVATSGSPKESTTRADAERAPTPSSGGAPRQAVGPRASPCPRVRQRPSADVLLWCRCRPPRGPDGSPPARADTRRRHRQERCARSLQALCTGRRPRRSRPTGACAECSRAGDAPPGPAATGPPRPRRTRRELRSRHGVRVTCPAGRPTGATGAGR